jgi:hypothetical protein
VPASSAATGTAPPVASTSGDAKDFGFSRAQLHIAEEGPKSIEAHVTRVSTSASGAVLVELDNGQSWSFHDESALPRTGELVTIKRGALGSYLMITQSKRTMHVERRS